MAARGGEWRPRFGSTSFRTFFVYPVVVVACELALHGALRLNPWFLPLWAWGYVQYRLAGRYRLARGGGGPGMDYTQGVRRWVPGLF